jgi:uncharacterized membrane protein YkoI
MLSSMIRVAIFAVLVGGLAGRVQAGPDVPIDQLPKPVVETVKKQFPNGELVEAETEKDQGQMVYEVEVMVAGEEKEIEVSPEGKIVEIDD